MATDPVTLALDGNLAIVTLDDGKANALSHAVLEGLIDAIDRAEREAAAMVLVGRPDRFCAGFDLKAMMAGPEAATKILLRGKDALMRLYGATLPLVIACTGHALAGGALVVLTGDTRIGAAGPYKIGLNEVQIGLPVPVLAMELARDRLRTSELVNATLMAKIYDPEGAVRAGYLDAVCPPGEVVAKAKDEARRLAGLPRAAYKATKQRLRGKTIAHIGATLEADLRTMLTPATAPATAG